MVATTEKRTESIDLGGGAILAVPKFAPGETVYHVAMHPGHHEICEGVFLRREGGAAVCRLADGDERVWTLAANHGTRREALTQYLASLGYAMEVLAGKAKAAAIELRQLDHAANAG